MKTERKCRGTGKASGSGCGTMVPQIHFGRANRIYGIGQSCGCYQKWLLETAEGGLHLSRGIKKGVAKHKSQQEKSDRIIAKKKKQKMTTALMTKDQYRSKVLQPIINHIAREIDKGYPCIATGNYGKENGGHYISVGSNVTICLNLHNIHIQSFESNHFKSGDTVKYRMGIISTYGKDYMNFMDSLQGCPALHVTKDDLILVASRARVFLKFLKDQPALKSTQNRVDLRNEVNFELGLYPTIYSAF
jgi:hypothetical protein